MNIYRPLNIPETHPAAIRMAPVTRKCPRRRDIESAERFSSLTRAIVASLVEYLVISSEAIAGQVRYVLTHFCLASRCVNRKSEVLRVRHSVRIAGQGWVYHCRDARVRCGFILLNFNQLLPGRLSALTLDNPGWLLCVRSGLLSHPVKDAFAAF